MYVLTERDWSGLPHALGAMLLIGAAAALLFVSAGSGGDSPQAAELVSQPSAGEQPQIAVRLETAEEPFTAAHASFRVLDHPGAGWASALLRRENPGAGYRWVVVAVEVENLGRRRFNPGLLPYLLRTDSGGSLLAPDRAGVVGPDGLGRASGLPVGARAEERLVYRVPAHTRRTVLSIQPSPLRALEVRVPLGPG
jgi:hypothetical protein